MFYEERYIDGMLHCRTSPRGDWHRIARWRDAYGQRYTAPAGEYMPGQFAPTGAQMLGWVRHNTELKRDA